MKFSELRVKNINLVLKHTPRVPDWKATKRSTHILGVQLRGRMEHDVNGEKVNLTENSFFFFNQKDDFSARVIDLGQSYSVHFSTTEPIQTETFVGKLRNPAKFIRLLEQLETLYEKNGANTNAALGYFYRLCAMIDEDSVKNTYHYRDSRMVSAKRYMDSNFKSKSCIDNAAMLCGITRRRFNDLFKYAFDTTPHEYVIQRKISAAQELLHADELTLYDISEMVGFNDIHHFFKTFKAKTGTTPSRYKKKNKIMSSLHTE